MHLSPLNLANASVHHVQGVFAKHIIYLVAVGQGSTTNVLKISDMSFWNALPMLPFAHAPNMLSSLPHPFYTAAQLRTIFAFRNQPLLAACIYDIFTVRSLILSGSAQWGTQLITPPWLSTYGTVADWRTRWPNHWWFLNFLHLIVVLYFLHCFHNRLWSHNHSVLLDVSWSTLWSLGVCTSL